MQQEQLLKKKAEEKASQCLFFAFQEKMEEIIPILITIFRS
jgi:hypothetical protein